MLTLGIDPGTATTGFGLVDQLGDRLVYIAGGCITTLAGETPQKRLGLIYHELKEIIKKHRPEAVAVERLFFGQNTKTAMAVGQARGIVLLAAAEGRLAVAEYTPLEVKMALTGYGKADKKQIQQMVKTLLKLDQLPKPDDAADALAIAISHIHSYKLSRVAV